MAGIYLDHQASTSVAPAVIEEMLPFLSGVYANPHSDHHAAGWAASAAVERARGRIAAAMGAETDEIVFTGGATEANNIAILGAAEAAPRAGRIVVSAIDHKSVLGPARALAKRGFEVAVAPVDADGLVDLPALRKLLDGETVLVSIGIVNNEVGVVQPMSEIVSMVRDRSDALVHTDATQALPWRQADVDALGVDLASVSSHKAGGPKGIGALFVSRRASGRVHPVMHGGGQEAGLRPGTLPTMLCVGFGAACANLPDDRGIAEWQSTTAELLALMSAEIPGLRLNGAASPRHPGNLNVMLPGAEADIVVARLQPRLAVSLGSACTSGMPEPSHVLTAMGLTAPEAEASIRISTSPTTARTDVAEAAKLILSSLAQVEARMSA